MLSPGVASEGASWFRGHHLADLSRWEGGGWQDPVCHLKASGGSSFTRTWVRTSYILGPVWEYLGHTDHTCPASGWGEP